MKAYHDSSNLVWCHWPAICSWGKLARHLLPAKDSPPIAPVVVVEIQDGGSDGRVKGEG